MVRDNMFLFRTCERRFHNLCRPIVCFEQVAVDRESYRR